MKSPILNTMGLTLTIIGTLLTWFFVGDLALAFVDKGAYLEGHAGIVMTDPKPKDIKKFKRNICLSRIGIGLIVLGEVLQILSNYCDA